MENSIIQEVDWLSAYYGMVTAWDATFSFWMTGTFSVDYDETLTATTNANGIAIFTTASEVQSPTFSFCVNGINHAALSYNAADNVENCDNYVGPAR